MNRGTARPAVAALAGAELLGKALLYRLTVETEARRRPCRGCERLTLYEDAAGRPNCFGWACRAREAA